MKPGPRAKIAPSPRAPTPVSLDTRRISTPAGKIAILNNDEHAMYDIGQQTNEVFLIKVAICLFLPSSLCTFF
jgi:hypothetical protein